MNHLNALCRAFSKDDLTNTILICLSKELQLEVMAMTESRNLATMTTITLFGKLIKHEQKLNHLKGYEEKSPKRRTKVYSFDRHFIQGWKWWILWFKRVGRTQFKWQMDESLCLKIQQVPQVERLQQKQGERQF